MQDSVLVASLPQPSLRGPLGLPPLIAATAGVPASSDRRGRWIGRLRVDSQADRRTGPMHQFSPGLHGGDAEISR